MRSKFDEQLSKLNNELIEMGGMIEDCLEIAGKALIDRDIDLAQTIKAYEEAVDEKERQIEGMCLRLLLQQQPVARDLRLISSAMKMITDMERIGDQAADIGEIVMVMGGAPYIKHLEHIPAMFSETKKMVKSSIDAFVRHDLELAREVIASDNTVDDLFITVRSELLALIGADASNGEQAFDLLMIAKYLERVGDHATNIAEWVEYAITGLHKEERLL